MLLARFVWTRRLLAATGLALALGWLPYQVYGASGLARLVKLRGEMETLRSGNARTRDENARLRAEISLSDEDDLGAVERAARDELGLVKPGELVFRLVEDKPTQGARP
jgi:cell division protein FtsB